MPADVLKIEEKYVTINMKGKYRCFIFFLKKQFSFFLMETLKTGVSLLEGAEVAVINTLSVAEKKKHNSSKKNN